MFAARNAPAKPTKSVLLFDPMNPNTETQLTPAPAGQLEPLPASSPLQILEAAVKAGITGENVAVVKELLAMRREEMNLENKRSFNRAFFLLKQKIATMDFYADKVAKTKSGEVAYRYCSESEIAEKLEPVLAEYGFALMFGQRRDADMVIVEITLIHRDGHEEKREYAVRTGAVNAMKDATAADAGSTTSAWRHLMIKLFGLKSRISETDDAANAGEKIGPEHIATLKEMVAKVGKGEAAFLKFARVDSFQDIRSADYDHLFRELQARIDAL